MGSISLNSDEMDMVATYINDEFDGIDLYPGDLDPIELGRAVEEVEALRLADGQGQLTPPSATLAADVLAFFRNTFASEMRADEVETHESTVAKLRKAGASSE